MMSLMPWQLPFLAPPLCADCTEQFGSIVLGLVDGDGEESRSPLVCIDCADRRVYAWSLTLDPRDAAPRYLEWGEAARLHLRSRE